MKYYQQHKSLIGCNKGEKDPLQPTSEAQGKGCITERRGTRVAINTYKEIIIEVPKGPF